MDNYRLLIFDLDGTIADTSPGIYECHRYANAAMGRAEPSDRELDGIIGGPLLKAYTDRFAFPEDKAREAVRIYREHYSEVGTDGAYLYPGLEKTLRTLRERDYRLAVATLKAERLAERILDKLGIRGCFDVIHGMDENDTRTKAGLLAMCMEETGSVPGNTALIGDSIHDAAGAWQAGTAFVGCTYGFGFHSAQDAASHGADAVISSPMELLELFK